jgi:hypothetical protein
MASGCRSLAAFIVEQLRSPGLTGLSSAFSGRATVHDAGRTAKIANPLEPGIANHRKTLNGIVARNCEFHQPTIALRSGLTYIDARSETLAASYANIRSVRLLVQPSRRTSKNETSIDQRSVCSLASSGGCKCTTHHRYGRD